jgi:enterobactin synthetase component D
VIARTRDPAVLPPFAAQYSLAIDADGVGELPDLFVEIELPVDLRRSVRRRQLQFVAGRYCALEAIRKLDRHRASGTLGRAPSGAAQWPEGLVGSITHTEGFVSAAAAHGRDALGLGIDSERFMSARLTADVSHLVATSAELSEVTAAVGLNPCEGLTLAFSAKESIFKCLYPLVGRYFDYLDAELCGIDLERHCFGARLRVDLSEALTAGLTLCGKFELGDEAVHTGVTLGAADERAPGVEP